MQTLRWNSLRKALLETNTSINIREEGLAKTTSKTRILNSNKPHALCYMHLPSEASDQLAGAAVALLACEATHPKLEPELRAIRKTLSTIERNIPRTHAPLAALLSEYHASLFPTPEELHALHATRDGLITHCDDINKVLGELQEMSGKNPTLQSKTSSSPFPADTRTYVQKERGMELAQQQCANACELLNTFIAQYTTVLVDKSQGQRRR